jgi:hypothetical protein
MQHQELADRFILHPSQGMSLNDLVLNLDIARSTLILWSRKYRFKIAVSAP